MGRWPEGAEQLLQSEAPDVGNEYTYGGKVRGGVRREKGEDGGGGIREEGEMHEN